MAKAGGKNPGGKVKSGAASLGSRSKGTQRGNIKGMSSDTKLVKPVNPSQSGAADVVAARNAMALQGKMLHDQLKKNKSTGIKI